MADNKTANHFSGPMRCPVSLEDVDLFSPGAQEHWYEAYQILHREAPVLKIPGEGVAPGSDGYILSCFEDIERVVKDPERFTPMMSLAVQALAQNNTGDTSGFNMALQSAITLRPNMTLWRTHRQELTDPWVGSGAKRHTQMITEIADRLIDDWIDCGEVEFIEEFARPLPQYVMARVLGLPESDVPQLAAWGTAQVTGFVHGRGHRNEMTEQQLADQVSQLTGFEDYVAEKVREKRANPADDMISFLTQVHYSPLDRKLTDLEIKGVVYFMVLGGLETTQYALEEQAQLLCDDPGLFSELQADTGKLRAFTEESMRVRAPTQGLSTRMTTVDEVFQGVAVPAGSLLHMRFAAGNVDPRAYVCPNKVQLDRKALGNHLTFSQGPRTCPGAGISRLEQLIAWQRLFQRVGSLRYGTDNTFEHQPGIMLGTLKLNLEFDPA
ncbi:MAG: cytochrome P450 [Halioglobus sp.]